jgi:hypothetical protein
VAADDLQALLQACPSMLADAEAVAQQRADHWSPADQILVGLPASQLRGRAWSIVQTRAQPERPVDERELEAMLGRALRLAVNRVRSAIRFSSARPRGGRPAPNSDAESWLLIEAALVTLMVDGRRVTDPVGFRGREIGATVFAALARAKTVEAWRKLAEKLEFGTLILTVAPMTVVLGLPEPEGVLLDVGGDTTDLTLWRAGRPVALSSLPTGGNALTQLLGRRWGLSYEDAERLKRAYTDGLLDEADQARVLEVMSPAVRTWAEELEIALARLDQEQPLPHRLYLLGAAAALPEMMEAARALAWSERLHFARYPQLASLRPTDVPGVVNSTKLGKSVGDVSALALAAWAARYAEPRDRPAQILAQLCGDQGSE